MMNVCEKKLICMFSIILFVTATVFGLIFGHIVSQKKDLLHFPSVTTSFSEPKKVSRESLRKTVGEIENLTSKCSLNKEEQKKLEKLIRSLKDYL